MQTPPEWATIYSENPLLSLVFVFLPVAIIYPATMAEVTPAKLSAHGTLRRAARSSLASAIATPLDRFPLLKLLFDVDVAAS